MAKGRNADKQVLGDASTSTSSLSEFDEFTASLREAVEAAGGKPGMDVSRIHALVDAMRAGYESNGAAKSASGASAGASLSFAFRGAVSSGNVEAGRALDLAIKCCQEQLAPSDLPFTLLEDVLETQSVMECETTWSLLEERLESLTDELFMPRRKASKGKLTLLRIANGLLRRLSQTHNTVFCGKIMMFLAYAFSLSERSGVNVLGSHNEENVTTFESEEEFNRNIRHIKTGGALRQSGDPAAPVDYTLYRAFWGIQNSFGSKPGVAPAGCFSGYKVWREFCDRSDLVLGAFESQPHATESDNDGRASAKRDDSKPGRSSSSMSEDVESTHGEFYCTKYLSSSQLLRLQLSDPSLRRHVLCQFLILCNSLLRDANMRLLDDGDGFKGGREGVTLSIRKTIDRVLKLMRSTPPHGRAFTAGVQLCLQRERNWVLWKDGKCKPFERYTDNDSEHLSDNVAPSISSTELRKMRATIRDNSKLWSERIDDWEKEYGGKERSFAPSTDSFLQPMLDAMDPENGIEEQYHPKHDKLYNWRGLRLIYASDLECLSAGKFDDGALLTAVAHRAEKNGTLPASMVAAEEEGKNDDDDAMDAKADGDAKQGTKRKRN